MNRISEATVTNGQSAGKLLVINRTEVASRADGTGMDGLGGVAAVARVVSHGGGGRVDDSESVSVSTTSKFESILSSYDAKKPRILPSDGPSLDRLKEKIERQKASRAIIPNIETRGTGNKVFVRKVASAQGPNTYLGFNTGTVDKEIQNVKVSTRSRPIKQAKSAESVVRKNSSEPTRKLAKNMPSAKSKSIITTRSWRDSQKQAKQMLKLESVGAKPDKKSLKTVEKHVKAKVMIEATTESESIPPSAGSSLAPTPPPPPAINSVDLEGILSEEVRGILKDLNLEEHLIPPPPEKVQKNVKSTRRKQSPREETPIKEQIKTKHYDPDEVKRFMQKQRAERRKTEMKQKEDKKTKQVKIELEMKKLRQRQVKMKKEQEKTKNHKPKHRDKAVDDIDQNAGFDPLAKAMEIISELDQKIQNKSEPKMERHVPQPSAAILENDATPALEDEADTVDMAASGQDEVYEAVTLTPQSTITPQPTMTPQNKKVLDYISNSIQHLEFHAQSRPILGESSQNGKLTERVSKDHSDLLENLRQKSLDINQRTTQWEEKIKQLADRREQKLMQNPPGVKNLDELCAVIPKVEAYQAEAVHPVPPVEKISLPLEDVECAPSIVESTSSIENRKPRKPVKFSRSHSPDELNMIDLMYQKERERRRHHKLDKNKKRRKQKSTSYDSSESSKNVISLSSKEVSHAVDGSMSSTTPIPAVIPADSDSDSISTVSHHVHSNTAATSTKSQSRRIDSEVATESIHDSVSLHSGIRSTADPLSTMSNLTKPSEISQDPTWQRKISTETDLTISENYSSVPTDTVPYTTATLETDAGAELHQIVTTQLQQADQADHHLRAIESYQTKHFLDQMRDIQRTGKKAADIMLKASQNLATKAEISLPTDTASSSVITPISEREKTDDPSMDHSSSATITSKISPRTDTAISSKISLRTDTVISPRTDTAITSQISPRTDTVIPTETSVTKQSEYTNPISTILSKTDVETETETDGKISESVISEKSYSNVMNESSAHDSYSTFASDMDVSTRLLTPSVEHWKKINEKIRMRIPSEQSDVSSEPDANLNDSFTRFMADMVKQYVADEKSTRTRFHYAMLHAREKAIKEKKKHDLAFEAKIQRSRKSRTPLNKKGEDEKMPKRQSIDHSESDTSSCTIERVKRWFSLDEKHLTQREYLLQKRRKKAEKLIAWKARLDEQEKSVIRIEQKASKALKEKKLREEPNGPLESHSGIEEHSIPESATTEETLNATTFSETDLDHSDIDTRMKVMRDQLKERERMAAQLRRALKKQTEYDRKKELKQHESTLRKQIEQFDNMILEAQTQLRNLDEVDQIGLKPKIRSPRKESTGSGSSAHSLRRLNSSDHSDGSPRRSPVPRSLKSPKTASSVSSESLVSPNEDEIKSPLSKTQISTHKYDESESVLKSSLESSVSVIEAVTNQYESEAADSVKSDSYTFSSHVDMTQSSSKHQSSARLQTKHSIQKTVEETQNNIANDILAGLVSDVIQPLSADRKHHLIIKLKGDQVEDSPERESVSSDEKDSNDDSLMQTLLDHAAVDVRCDENLDDTNTTGSIPPHYLLENKRTFEEVCLCADRFCSYLYNAPFPYPTEIPANCFNTSMDDGDDLQVAMWNLCCELAAATLDHHPEQIANQYLKPWQRARILSRPKFSKFRPSSRGDLNECVVNELGRLLSINGPKLDKRIIQKMGSRSKKDRVDLLLIGELREEEKVWTDYEQDEQTVKDHLTESIFTLLLDDTIKAVKDCIQ